jgi:tetratricopeptide (TPR) repeat protein
MRWFLSRSSGREDLARGESLLGTPKHRKGIRRVEAAIRKLVAATRREPEDAENFYLLCRAHSLAPRYREALDSIDRAILLDPANHEYIYNKSYVLIAIKNYEGAVRAMTRAVDLAPDRADYRFRLALAHSGGGEKGLALQHYRRAIELDPHLALAYYNVGVLLADSGDDEEAIAMFRKAASLDPGLTDAHSNIGQLRYNEGKFHDALESFLAALWTDPDGFATNKKVVQAYYALGRYEEAEPFRSRLLALHRSPGRPDFCHVSRFCFDQFYVDDYQVFAYENFHKSGDLWYHYVFEAVGLDGGVALTVNLESSLVLRELGGGYLLGMNDAEGHSTFDIGWAELPPYPEVKTAVIEALQGRYPIVGRSRTEGGRVVIEYSPRSETRDVDGGAVTLASELGHAADGLHW